ncbi:hypothetical protein HHK36_020728 [Tetracentron sinense]|uniref:F-box domain-containing protein n=1 Tax=Tetracentron sinense TaxID=13715 RepID=A0A835D898_TETSI|nr:hypothetical protein HHK36_020728 [Tetracentron sinense]
MKSVNMQQWGWNQNSFPEDISLKIASFLQVSDLCALGGCSWFLRELCASDCIWESLSRERWPYLDFSKESPLSMFKIRKNDQNMGPCSSVKGWRGFYLNRHNEMARKTAAVINFVEQCSPSKSLEVGDYKIAIRDLCSMQLGFKDVQMFLFKSNLNALHNLVGLHYCIYSLGVPVEYVMEALWSCQISERQVYVRWWKLGRWIYGFRMRDESHTYKVSLRDLAAKEKTVFDVLQRGAIYEVLRVHVSV